MSKAQSVSPEGEAFPLPGDEEYGPEYERLEQLVEDARAHEPGEHSGAPALLRQHPRTIEAEAPGEARPRLADEVFHPPQAEPGEVGDLVGREAQGRDGKLAANWVTGELFRRLNEAGVEIEASPVSAGGLGGLLDLIADGTISGRIAKDVFAEMCETGRDAEADTFDARVRAIRDSD